MSSHSLINLDLTLTKLFDTKIFVYPVGWATPQTRKKVARKYTSQLWWRIFYVHNSKGNFAKKVMRLNLNFYGARCWLQLVQIMSSASTHQLLSQPRRYSVPSQLPAQQDGETLQFSTCSTSQILHPVALMLRCINQGRQFYGLK